MNKFVKRAVVGTAGAAALATSFGLGRMSKSSSIQPAQTTTTAMPQKVAPQTAEWACQNGSYVFAGTGKTWMDEKPYREAAVFSDNNGYYSVETTFRDGTRQSSDDAVLTRIPSEAQAEQIADKFCKSADRVTYVLQF